MTEINRREYVRRAYIKLSMEECWAHSMRGGCTNGSLCKYCHVGHARRAIY